MATKCVEGLVAEVVSRPRLRYAKRSRRPVLDFKAVITRDDGTRSVINCAVRGEPARRLNRLLTTGSEVRVSGDFRLVPVLEVRRIAPIKQRFRAQLAS